MTSAVPLPEWIEQPVLDPGLTPIHDAIGKFVQACKGLEVVLTIVYGRSRDASYFDAEKAPVSRQVKDLAALAHLIPEGDRAEFERAMRDAAEILAVRYGVLHGIGFPDVSETTWQSRRPNRAVKSDDSAVVAVTWNRELLIGAGRRAIGIRGFLMARAMHWFQRMTSYRWVTSNS